MKLASLLKLDIAELATALEQKMQHTMQDLSILGDASKKLTGKERDECYLAMAEVFHELRPVEGYVRYNFPELHNTFNTLVDVYARNKAPKFKRTKRKPVKRVITHPDDKVAPQTDFDACLELNSFDKN